MRASAQVFKIAVPVGRDWLVLRDFADYLQLQGFISVESKSFVSRVFAVFEGEISGDDLLHAAFDSLQVFIAKGFGREEVVIEAVLRGRTDGELYVREHLRDHIRHHVRRRMANALSQVRRCRESCIRDIFGFLQICLRAGADQAMPHALCRDRTLLQSGLSNRRWQTEASCVAP